jgi:hypothetical protein
MMTTYTFTSSLLSAGEKTHRLRDELFSLLCPPDYP